MQDFIVGILILNLIVNLALVFGWISIRRQISEIDYRKFRNLVLEMMKIREKFDETSSGRIKELSEKINYMQELAEVIDEKILYYESMKNDDTGIYKPED